MGLKLRNLLKGILLPMLKAARILHIKTGIKLHGHSKRFFDNHSGAARQVICAELIKFTTMDYHTYKKCIEACLECAAICNHCASACLKEEDVKMMAPCIQLDMECAATCYYAAQMMSIGSRRSEEICSICAQLCRECADECERHDNEHCRECAKMCRKCAEEYMEVTEVF